MSLFGDSAGNCHLTISAPSAGGVGSGEYTVAILFKPIVFNSSNMIWRGYQSSGFSFRGLYVDGDMYLPNEQADTNIPSFANPVNWYWFVVSRGVSDEAPRAHWALYDGSSSFSWTHLDALSVQTTRTAIDRFCLGDEFGSAFKGHVACMAAFVHEMADLDIELFFDRSSADVLTAEPDFFVHWPQADGVGSLFEDIAGGGIETIRTGTWDVSADPPSFDFAIRSGKPKVWNGSNWISRSAKLFDGSSWVPHQIAGYDGTQWVTSK